MAVGVVMRVGITLNVVQYLGWLVLKSGAIREAAVTISIGPMAEEAQVTIPVAEVVPDPTMRPLVEAEATKTILRDKKSRAHHSTLT